MQRLLFGLAIVAALGAPAFAAGADHVPLVRSDGPCGFIVTHAARTTAQQDACSLYVLAMRHQHPTQVILETGGRSSGGGTIIVQSKGDTGATGATGPAGPAGPEGPQGPKGGICILC